jgi:hypothetical protein
MMNWKGRVSSRDFEVLFQNFAEGLSETKKNSHYWKAAFFLSFFLYAKYLNKNEKL